MSYTGTARARAGRRESLRNRRRDAGARTQTTAGPEGGEVIIAAGFNGPPGTGNGGYSAGLFSALGAPSGDTVVEVTLRRPPPLDVPLTAVGGEVRDPAGELVAGVRTVERFDAVVPGVSWGEAVRVSASYAGFSDHPFPTCYVCGPARADGLRVFPGRLADGRTAAPFVVPALVDPPTAWAVLDCPGGWSIIAPGRPYVLGRMAAVVRTLPQPGEQCVVVGATESVQGRKALVRSTLYGPDGEVLAYARATWIAI